MEADINKKACLIIHGVDLSCMSEIFLCSRNTWYCIYSELGHAVDSGTQSSVFLQTFYLMWPCCLIWPFIMNGMFLAHYETNKMQRLPPNTFRSTSTKSTISCMASSNPRWLITCRPCCVCADCQCTVGQSVRHCEAPSSLTRGNIWTQWDSLPCFCHSVAMVFHCGSVCSEWICDPVLREIDTLLVAVVTEYERCQTTVEGLASENVNF